MSGKYEAKTPSRLSRLVKRIGKFLTYSQR